jgi:hypothetical protein
MSDDKKSEKNKPAKPLENPDVFVNVVPKDAKNPEHKKMADRIEKNLKENVKKAIEENKRNGQEKQFGAAESETKKAGQSANKREVEKINVRVAGKDGDGDVAHRGWSVTPKEGKPSQ